MPKSITTIHREILKKEYAKSPLGIVEKKLGKIWDDFRTKKLPQLPEDVSKQVYDIREANEKAVEAYIDERLKKDREKIDNMLLESMTSELNLLEAYLNKHDGQ